MTNGMGIYGAICAAKILHRRREFQFAREPDTSEIPTCQPVAAPPCDQLTSLDRRKCPHGVDQVGDYANVLVSRRCWRLKAFVRAHVERVCSSIREA